MPAIKTLVGHGARLVKTVGGRGSATSMYIGIELSVTIKPVTTILSFVLPIFLHFMPLPFRVAANSRIRLKGLSAISAVLGYQ